jgi:LacI family transcriptional regulator
VWPPEWVGAEGILVRSGFYAEPKWRPPMQEQSSVFPAVSEDPDTEHKLPRVLLVFNSRDDCAAAMLRGVAHYVQQTASWSAHVEDSSCATVEFRWKLAEGCCGVISRNTTAALVELCAELDVPLVDLDDSPQYAGVSKIRPDNMALGVMGGECLLARGFRSFGFVGCNGHGWARERKSGFVEAVRLDNNEVSIFDLELVDERTSDRGVGVMVNWLNGLPKPLGVMACDDRRAALVLEAARLGGYQVPEEVAVLGAGNDAARCELATPPLSSVDPGAFLVGYRAAEHLAQRLDDRRTPVCDLRIEPAGVVTRRSTDVLAVPDRSVAAAVRYIADHACEGLTVGEVLPHAAVSRAQLEKKFRQHLGRTPQAEIRRVQVARIRQLLADTDLPLKSIAELTGFDYMEYMCVVFRRLTGETPGSYRRRQQPRSRPEHGPDEPVQSAARP